MSEKKTKESGSEISVLDAEAFSKKFPTSKGNRRGRSERIQLAIDTVGKMIEEKDSGYVLVGGDPFFGSGVAAAIKKQYPKAENITLHWFDTQKPGVKDEIEKFTKEKSRFLVQIEIV